MLKQLFGVAVWCVLSIVALSPNAKANFGTLTTKGQNNTKLNEAISGYEVRFPGIDEEIRVFPLERAARDEGNKKGLAGDLLAKLALARERNASWLIRDRRGKSRTVSLEIQIMYESGKEYRYEYRGKYFPGILLVAPSEFMLYYSDPRDFEYKEDDEFFYVIRKPYKGRSSGYLRPYMTAGGMTPFLEPISWLSVYRLEWLGRWAQSQDHPGHELWFSKSDYRLVREVTWYLPTDVSPPVVPVHGRVEAIYYYSSHPQDSHPERVAIKSSTYGYPELANATLITFKMVNGLCFVDKALLLDHPSPRIVDKLSMISMDSTTKQLKGTLVSVTVLAVQ